MVKLNDLLTYLQDTNWKQTNQVKDRFTVWSRDNKELVVPASETLKDYNLAINSVMRKLKEFDETPEFTYKFVYDTPSTSDGQIISSDEYVIPYEPPDLEVCTYECNNYFSKRTVGTQFLILEFNDTRDKFKVRGANIVADLIDNKYLDFRKYQILPVLRHYTINTTYSLLGGTPYTLTTISSSTSDISESLECNTQSLDNEWIPLEIHQKVKSKSDTVLQYDEFLACYNLETGKFDQIFDYDLDVYDSYLNKAKYKLLRGRYFDYFKWDTY